MTDGCDLVCGLVLHRKIRLTPFELSWVSQSEYFSNFDATIAVDDDEAICWKSLECATDSRGELAT